MLLLGLIFITVGTLMLVFNRQIYSFTGGLDFIENHFRAGTPSFLKLFAVVLVFVGILMATGLGGWLTSPLRNLTNSIFPHS